METYATWARLFELHRHYSWVVDRFHLSTMAYQRLHRGRDEDFEWLEERLEPLGFHIVLCTRPEDTFEVARTERLKVSGKPSQYDDLGLFIEEQAVLRALAAASRLPVLELDVSDGDVAGGVERIADWMTATGGLWAPGPRRGDAAGVISTGAAAGRSARHSERSAIAISRSATVSASRPLPVNSSSNAWKLVRTFRMSVASSTETSSRR